ncbi:MAG: hypothetical protein ACHQ52_07135 [Candidatus Eisenbacteria bacterium]
MLSAAATNVALGAGGGLLVKLVELAELRRVPPADRPSLRDPIYWIPVFLWPCAGALLVYVYAGSDQPMSRALALNIGVSAPLIIRTMASSLPTGRGVIEPGPGA